MTMITFLPFNYMLLLPLAFQNFNFTCDKNIHMFKELCKRPQHHLVTRRSVSWAHMNQPPNGILIGLAVFVYTTAETHNAFQWGGQLPHPKIAPFSWGIRNPSHTCFLGPTRVRLFAGIVNVANRQTDRYTHRLTTLLCHAM